MAPQDRFSVLPRPFWPDEVRRTLESAVSRVEADFRSLRAEVNEAGALKNFFVDGGALSAPQSNAPVQVISRSTSSAVAPKTAAVGNSPLGTCDVPVTA